MRNRATALALILTCVLAGCPLYTPLGTFDDTKLRRIEGTSGTLAKIVPLGSGHYLVGGQLSTGSSTRNREIYAAVLSPNGDLVMEFADLPKSGYFGTSVTPGPNDSIYAVGDKEYTWNSWDGTENIQVQRRTMNGAIIFDTVLPIKDAKAVDIATTPEGELLLFILRFDAAAESAFQNEILVVSPEGVLNRTWVPTPTFVYGLGMAVSHDGSILVPLYSTAWIHDPITSVQPIEFTLPTQGQSVSPETVFAFSRDRDILFSDGDDYSIYAKKISPTGDLRWTAEIALTIRPQLFPIYSVSNRTKTTGIAGLSDGIVAIVAERFQQDAVFSVFPVKNENTGIISFLNPRGKVMHTLEIGSGLTALTVTSDDTFLATGYDAQGYFLAEFDSTGALID